MELESDLESRVSKRLLDNHGIPGVKLAMILNSGWPDHLYVGPNARVVFVEYKRGGNVLSPRQKYIRRLLKALRFTVLVARDEKQVIREVCQSLGVVA